jgi:hypothetical protein
MAKGHLIPSHSFLKNDIIEDVRELIDEIKDSSTGISGSFTDAIITLPLENWLLNEENEYIQNIEVGGLVKGSNPIILLKPAGDEETEDELNAYTCLTDVVVDNGNITFVADTKPGITFDVIIKSVVTNGGNITVDTAEIEAKINTLENTVNNNLTEAKQYADDVAKNVKNDLLNGAGDAYDTLKELGTLIDENTDAIGALETVATGKADSVHTHHASQVSTQFHLLEKVDNGYQPPTGGNYTVDSELSRYSSKIVELGNSLTDINNTVLTNTNAITQLNSDLETKPTMSGTYAPEMSLSDVYASMDNNTFFAFTAENGSVIHTELGLNSSRGIRFFISREHQWRGFAIGSVNGADSKIYIANVTGENVMTMHEISKKNDFIEYEFSASVEVKSGLTAENSTVVIPTGIPTSEKIVSATLTSGNSVIPMWLADVNYVGATIGFTNPWNVNRITTCKLIVTTRRIYY